jgi:hypothetical protein
LNDFPLYASANSAASAAFGNLMTTIDRLGAESLRAQRLDVSHNDMNTNAYLIILRWAMPPAAGATKPKKSDGVIHDGTAKTASITPPVDRDGGSSSYSVSRDGLGVELRSKWTVPSGRFIEPDFDRVWGIKVAVAGPGSHKSIIP